LNFIILACDTQYNATEFLEFILSSDIKNQKPNIFDTLEGYECNNCDEYIEEEYFENDYDGGNLCRRCFECMRDALIIKKENVTFVYINDKPSSPIYIMREGASEHIYVSIINTNSLRIKMGCNRHVCVYCRNEKSDAHDYIEKCGNDITMCKKCLKFRKYASFMNNYNFVYIKEIFIINNLLPELKKNIAKYMLRVVAY